MPADSRSPLTIVLIADDNYRIALLRRAVRDAGIACTVYRVPLTTGARALLKPKSRDGSMASPDLVLCDFASVDSGVCHAVKAVAFGSQRARVPVILLTSEASEELLDSGKLDDGTATMFSARPLQFILSKLAGDGRRAFLRALATLYRYGPVLARQPDNFLRAGDDETELSA